VDRLLDRFERIISTALIVMMVGVVALATIELGWLVISDLLDEGEFLLGISELLDLFGFFMLVLIGLELLETIRAYLAEHVVHAEVVIEVAVIAVTRKVIILDVKELEPLALIGIASIVLALGITFWIIKRLTRRGEMRKA
jgi:uncharacterized membrane protein (DUF373 family)